MEVSQNSYAISFINIKNHKSVIYTPGANAKTICDIVLSCTLIGLGNSKYEDLFMNYIIQHQDLTQTNLYQLHNEIMNMKTDLWRNKTLLRYMSGGVDSADLMKSTIDVEPLLRYRSGDIAAHAASNALLVMDALKRFKMALNDGYRKSYGSIPDSEGMRNNYLITKLYD